MKLRIDDELKLMSQGRAIAGTCVALSSVAMRLSEIITIYLAAGAPFSVSYFLHEQAHESSSHRILRGLLVGLLWPFSTIRMIIIRYAKSNLISQSDRASRQQEEKIHESKRHLLADLHMVSELGARVGGGITNELERATCVLRENVEKYVGLATAVGEASVSSSPNDKAIELFRVAGLTGDDLVLAAKCAQRRNAVRMLEHHMRARTQLIHALADIYEALCSSQFSIAGNLQVLPNLKLAINSLFDRAFDLLLLMGDEEAAIKVASLVGHKNSQERRSKPTEPGKLLALNAKGEPCTAQVSRPGLAPSSNETTMAHG